MFQNVPLIDPCVNKTQSALGSNKNVVIIYPPSQKRSFADFGARPMSFHIDDGYVGKIQNAVSDKVLNKDARLSTNLINNAYTDGVFSASYQCDHVIDMTNMNHSYIFMLILINQTALPVHFFSSPNAVQNVSNALRSFRVIYTGYFSEEPYDRRTKAFNPNAAMVFLHQTVLTDPLYNSNNALMTNNVFEDSNIVIPAIVENMATSATPGSDSVAPHLYYGTQGNLVESLHLGDSQISTNMVLGAPQMVDTSAASARDPYASNYDYALRSMTGPQLTQSKDVSPDKVVGRIIGGLTQSIRAYSNNTVPFVTQSNNGTIETFVDNQFGNFGEQLTLTETSKQNTFSHLYGIDTRIPNLFIDVYNKFAPEIVEIEVDVDPTQGFGKADQRINNAPNSYRAILSYFIPPILINHGVSCLMVSYTSARLQNHWDESPTDGFVTHFYSFYSPKGTGERAAIETLYSELKRTVFSLLKTIINGDFNVSIKFDGVDATYMVEVEGSIQTYEMQQTPTLLSGLIDPLVSTNNVFSNNQQYLQKLYHTAMYDVTSSERSVPNNMNMNEVFNPNIGTVDPRNYHNGGQHNSSYPSDNNNIGTNSNNNSFYPK